MGFATQVIDSFWATATQALTSPNAPKAKHALPPPLTLFTYQLHAILAPMPESKQTCLFRC